MVVSKSESARRLTFFVLWLAASSVFVILVSSRGGGTEFASEPLVAYSSSDSQTFEFVVADNGSRDAVSFPEATSRTRNESSQSQVAGALGTPPQRITFTDDRAAEDSSTQEESTTNQAPADPAAEVTAADMSAAVGSAAPFVSSPTDVLVTAVATAAPAVPTRVPTTEVGPDGPPGVTHQIPPSVFQWLEVNGWAIDWRPGPGPGRVAEANRPTKTIIIWYTTDRSDAIWAGAIAHELGHAVSGTYFSSVLEAEWLALRGISTWAWQPGMQSDFAVGEGDFAEAFMSYLLGHPVRSVGGPLTPQARAWIGENTPF